MAGLNGSCAATTAHVLPSGRTVADFLMLEAGTAPAGFEVAGAASLLAGSSSLQAVVTL